jgi:phosphohistidine swiveling domain-containing protein
VLDTVSPLVPSAKSPLSLESLRSEAAVAKKKEVLTRGAVTYGGPRRLHTALTLAMQHFLPTPTRATKSTEGRYREGTTCAVGQGVGVSGVYEGVARVIKGPTSSSASLMLPGDILITGSMSPSMSSYLAIAGAVVFESGGILSSAAITARELGKISIVGCAFATAIFKDGDRLRIDGTRGTVKRLKPLAATSKR